MSDEPGQSKGWVTVGGQSYFVTVTADGPTAPNDLVLLDVGEEWGRRANAGEPWRAFPVNGPEGSFAVVVSAGAYVTGVTAGTAAAAFVEKVRGGETPVAPV